MFEKWSFCSVPCEQLHLPIPVLTKCSYPGLSWLATYEGLLILVPTRSFDAQRQPNAATSVTISKTLYSTD
jgi:hypothetical protein